MGKVISVALQKGGVGKTSTALAIAGILGVNHKVLLIDMDSQANSTYASGVNGMEHTITDILAEECPAEKAVIKCKRYDLLAADGYLTNVEMAAVQPTILRDAIKNIRRKYDYIIIDTPPALGNLSINALTASDYVLIPTETRPLAFTGLTAMLDTIHQVKDRFNPKLKILGILLVRYNDRTNLNKNFKDMLEDFCQRNVIFLFMAPVHDSVVVPESQAMQQPLIDYAPHSKPCEDYIKITEEIIKLVGGK